MPHQNTVLILQGGGALGAYQAGVYQQLHEHHMPLEWVIGTSIGAINSALIAGNPPETRIAQLRAFWQSLAPQPSHKTAFWPMFAPWQNIVQSMNMFGTLINGVEGFFKPRIGAAWNLDAKVPLANTGFYDTSPLKSTLEKYVDFDYLNQGAIRVSICAVDIDNGQCEVFDSRKQKLRAEHIMASGALPPGFPPIEIDGRAYWDGGVYSNTPLEVFLEEDADRDALCFMVDLWDPTETRPTSISEALTRYKSIQYASRSKEQLVMHQKIQDLQKAIRILGKKLPVDEYKKKEMQQILRLGHDHTVNVVHLIMKAVPGDHYFKDIDFCNTTIEARWQAGIIDCQRALGRKAWLQPLPPHAGLIIHELPQE
jgi:NTE family protein